MKLVLNYGGIGIRASNSSFFCSKYLSYAELDKRFIDFVDEYNLKKRDIRSIHLIKTLYRNNYLFDKYIAYVVAILGDEYCKIRTLQLSGSFVRYKYFRQIYNAIQNNRTINNLLFDKQVRLKHFQDAISVLPNYSLQKCNNIRKLEIHRNFILDFENAKHIIPLSVEYMYISGDLMVWTKEGTDFIVYILQNLRLKVLDTYLNPDVLPKIVIDVIKNNRFLIGLNHYNKEMNSIIINVMKRNRRSLIKATKAALTILLIRNRNYKKDDCDLNFWIPKELVSKIAKLVRDSYDDPKWNLHRNKSIVAVI